MNDFIIEQELQQRHDFRDVLTFTIDPDSAKDFDDALSFRQVRDNLLEVGVHIADVSFYVKQHSDIDNEAYERGTSVYLVDNVIPMLPSQLCDDICSLRQGVDRLCLSVIFKVDQNANIRKYKIVRTVINSNARLTYQQAQQMLDAQTDEKDEIQLAIKQLWHLAHIFREQRIKKGALAIVQSELRFEIGDKGLPIGLTIEMPQEAHFLIEEWMLLANKTIAEHVRHHPFIYRVHGKPSKTKLSTFKHLSKLLAANQDTFKDQLIEMLAIRSMEKAIYSTRNTGHYGLAFSHYTHFTSPIRRYPDLIVHRLITHYFLPQKEDAYPIQQLKQISEHCSQKEQEAQYAERESIKAMQLKWLQLHQHTIFDAHIVSTVEYGFFVQLNDSLCEGLVRMRQLLTVDNFEYFPTLCRWRGENRQMSFGLGDKVKVKILKLNFEKNQVDFELVL